MLFVTFRQANNIVLNSSRNFPESPFCYTEAMQKIATRIFVYASIAFGIFGLLVVLTLPGPNKNSSDLNVAFSRFLFATVFIILPSFALSVASKYLNGKS